MCGDRTGEIAQRMGEALLEALNESVRYGFLGTTAQEAVSRSRSFLPLIPEGARVADLGSGGGVPGLVLAYTRTDLNVVLIDSRERRCDHLTRLVGKLELTDRVGVLHDRAEAIGHHVQYRHAFDVVVARSFGPPAVVAECAAALLRLAGDLLVSASPESAGERWPSGGLEQLGLAWSGMTDGIDQLVSLRKCGPEFPRKSVKSPLF